MRKKRRGAHRSAPGTRPGILVPHPDAQKSQIRVVSYSGDEVSDHESTTLEDVRALRDSHTVTWVDIVGLLDTKLIQRVGAEFKLHSLALEDVVNTHQRPKLEDYGDHLFIVVHMPTAGGGVATEQMSLFVGRDFVVTFQEQSGDWFDPVRQRIQQHGTRVRERGADFLAYALIDAVIDSYFPLVESIGEFVDQLEIEVMENPRQNHIADIHEIRRELLHLRRAIWPMRELLNGLLRDKHTTVQETTEVYLRDCYDHTVQLMDMVDTSREMVGSLIDIHLTATNNRMNEIMKVLTIIATIFIPLSFIASVYGMNFDTSNSPWNMPELEWRFGYVFVLLIMLGVSAALLIWFWRRGWIGRRLPK